MVLQMVLQMFVAHMPMKQHCWTNNMWFRNIRGYSVNAKTLKKGWWFCCEIDTRTNHSESVILRLVWEPWPAGVPRSQEWYPLCLWFPWGRQRTSVQCQYDWCWSLTKPVPWGPPLRWEKEQPWACHHQDNRSESIPLHHWKMLAKSSFKKP